MKLVAALVLAGLPPSIHPWPIGVGPRYQLPARPAVVRAGHAVGTMRCGTTDTRFRVHLEVFANRRVVILPTGIGRGPGCVYPVRTTTPTGVVNVGAQARSATVGDVFRVWGQALGPKRLLSFRSARGTRVYVAGHRRLGDPRAVTLTPGAEIVIEIGGYVPPHTSYLFPKGMP